MNDVHTFKDRIDNLESKLDRIIDLLADGGGAASEQASEKDAHPWLTKALAYEGLDEETDNEELSAFLGLNPSTVPWCGAFVSACLRAVDLPVSDAPNQAKSYASYGTACECEVGAIAVWRSHVAFVAEVGDVIKVIGGNQSDEVNVSPAEWYDRYSKFIGFRMPT